MKTSIVNKLIGTRTTSKWATMVLWVSSLVMAAPAYASNPWGRAVGEAQCLHDVTEDLRNRVNRLCPNSIASRLACVVDESACQILDMVKGGADWVQLQSHLQCFQQLESQLCHAVDDDCHLARDRGIQNYLRMIDDRFGDLVRDLSKCKPPAPNCHTAHSYSYQPSILIPYSSNNYGAIPRVPQPMQPQPVYPNGVDPHDGNPGTMPSVPQYWQGSLPRGANYPQSTYDNESMVGLGAQGAQGYAGKTSAVEHPIAAEILTLLLSRVQR